MAEAFFKVIQYKVTEINQLLYLRCWKFTTAMEVTSSFFSSEEQFSYPLRKTVT